MYVLNLKSINHCHFPFHCNFQLFVEVVIVFGFLVAMRVAVFPN